MSAFPGLIVDSFAGGGGASTGIEQALGRPVDIAINHDDQALAMHRANHPETRCLNNNIWRVDPDDIRREYGEVGLAWFSPDCKHHSKAKGGRPVKRAIRDLAWVVVHWAKRARPRVIMVENVEEFRQWGPVLETGMPCKQRKGETFKRWAGQLRRMGYRVEWKELRACDYGAPTIRKRLFVIARRDHEPIIWPRPTHGPGRIPFRTAADIIDWSLPCPSIFLTRDEAQALRREHGIRCKRPLADATMRRVAHGAVKYVLQAQRPFIAPITHTGDSRVNSIDEPLRTITTAKRGEHALVAPYLVPRYGEAPGQEPRCAGVENPISAIVPSGNGAGLVAAFLAQHNTGVIGRAASEPVSTLTQRGAQQQVVAAHLSQLYSSNNGGGGDLTDPMPTGTTGGHHALIAGFLTKYYSQGGQWCGADEPFHTITTRDRMGLVVVRIEGADFVLTDIGMRMLTARERFRAQGFPESYVIDRDADGNPFTLETQGRMCGNSVCPQVARALVSANCATAAMENAA